MASSSLRAPAHSPCDIDLVPAVLAYDDAACQALIGRAGRVRALVKLARNGSVEASAKAAAALWNLAGDFDNQQDAVSAGGVAVLVDVLRGQTKAGSEQGRLEAAGTPSRLRCLRNDWDPRVPPRLPQDSPKTPLGGLILLKPSDRKYTSNPRKQGFSADFLALGRAQIPWCRRPRKRARSRGAKHDGDEGACRVAAAFVSVRSERE